MRWNHPRLGYLPPLEFLPLAEDAELMMPLTSSCSTWRFAVRAWHADGSDGRISVDLSAHQPPRPAAARSWSRGARAATGWPSALVLEVTETPRSPTSDRSQETIKSLRDLGVVVSVDDFGAGFTSLAYLWSLASTS